MAKTGDYQIENIYQGGYSSLNPSYGSVFTGYHVSAGELGAPTKPDTANQIQQVNQLLNQGIVPIEVGALQPEVFEQIPKQHFKEINRMAKLTGAKISLHAPIIEPSGIDPEQRRPWHESYRELAEKQLSEVVKRAMEMSDKESVPITIHGSNIPGTEYKVDGNGKEIDKLVAIDRDSGKMIPLEEERLYYPNMVEVKEENIKRLEQSGLTRSEIKRRIEQGKIKESEVLRIIPVSEGEITTPEERLHSLNHTQWDNSISQLIFNKERADEILEKNALSIQDLYDEKGMLKYSEKTIAKDPIAKRAYSHLENAKDYIEDIRTSMNSLFHKAYKYGTEDQRKRLSKWSEDFREDLQKNPTVVGQSDALNNLMRNLKTIVPNMYVPIEDFAVDNSSKTFANVAFDAYQESKKKNKPAPTINIENLFPGMSFSTGEKMNLLILESRKKFVDKAKSKGMSESEAKKQAEKMIGMTLDVGHLNIFKKKGFKDK